jgi:hypothetical protein
LRPSGKRERGIWLVVVVVEGIFAVFRIDKLCF